MSMIKVIGPGAVEHSEPQTQLVKRSSGGLLGNDRAVFEKRASVNMLKDLDKLIEKIASDETLIHLLAVGATESYGANRNGDGFRSVTCQNYHPTFEKYAHFYRNHKNKDPKKSYGRIIKSAWNDPMQRIELLVALNSSDAAARRNDGLLADRELEKLAAGKDIPVSMACKVAYDICSWCGNQAPTTKEYCKGTHEGGMCKAGGLKNNMGALVEIDGGLHQLHADNPHPAFFDISHVFRPADRIAYVMGTLEKQASHGKVKSGADLAHEMGLVMPYELMVDGQQPKHVERLIKLAYTLSEMEADITSSQFSTGYITAFDNELTADVVCEKPEFFKEKFASAMRALVDYRVCLPLDRFVELISDQSREKSAEVAAVVARELPGIYTRLLEDASFTEKVKESQYNPSDATAPPALQKWAIKLAGDFSLAEQHVERRAARAALRLKEANNLRAPLHHEKVASCNDPVGKLAEQYALYKLAFLGSISEQDPNLALTTHLALLQNYSN